MSQNRKLAETLRDQLRQKDARMEEQQRQVQELQQQLNAANEAKMQLEMSVGTLQQQYQALYTQMSMMQPQDAFQQGYARGTAEANAKLQQAEERIRGLQQELAEANRKLQQRPQQVVPPHVARELKTAKEELEKVQRRYQGQRGELKATQENVKSLNEQLQVLNAQWQKTSDEKAAAYQEKLAGVEQELERYKRRWREIKKENLALKQQAFENENTIAQQREALESARSLKRALPNQGEESPVAKRVREPVEVSPNISSQEAAALGFLASATSTTAAISADQHALLFSRKLEALREAFTLYAVIAESTHATRSKTFVQPETFRVDCGNGSWFSFSADVVTTRAPALAIRVGRETLFDDCLERVSKRSLNTMAKFVEVSFVRSDTLVTKKRRENATDEGGLVTEMFTLFFESLPNAGIPVKQPVAEMLRCDGTAVRMFDPSQGYLFPAKIEIDGMLAQVLPENANLQSVQPATWHRDAKFRAHLDELWKCYEKIGKVYNQAIRQGHPIPELMLHPLLFHFLICVDDYPTFRTLSESSETIAGWLRSFDEEYTWFCNGVLNDDYDQMIASLGHAEIPMENRISAHEFHALQAFQKDAKRKLWLAEFVNQRIYQPCIGALRALRQGFQSFPITRHLSMFTWEEFKRIAIGVQEVSAEKLASIIELDGSREFRAVFLDAIRHLSDEEVRSFLFFCTAMRHLHEGSVVRVEEDTSVAIGAYPRAFTCFQQLKVPFQQGTSPDVVLASLRSAINTNRVQKFEYDEG